MHYEKTANGGEYGLIRHDNRTYVQHSNEKIDPERSHLNKNLTRLANPDDSRTEQQRFKDRLAECSYRKQKNNVRMCSIVIHAPKNVPANDLGRFFAAARNELQRQTGGAANEVYAWVHMDETTPHMHYAFVPAIEVDGTLKLSAKRLIDRNKLNRLHDDMQKAIDKAFGHHNYLVVADDPADRAKGSVLMNTYKALCDKLNKCKEELFKTLSDGEFEKLQQEIDLNTINKAIEQAAGELEHIRGIKQQELDSLNHIKQELQR